MTPPLSPLVKIQRGTRSDGDRLCDTCHSATIIRGAADSDETVYCLQINQRVVPTRVVECSRYQDKSKPTLWDMEQIAWVLVTKGAGKQIGFMSAQQWRENHPTATLMPRRWLTTGDCAADCLSATVRRVACSRGAAWDRSWLSSKTVCVTSWAGVASDGWRSGNDSIALSWISLFSLYCASRG